MSSPLMFWKLSLRDLFLIPCSDCSLLVNCVLILFTLNLPGIVFVYELGIFCIQDHIPCEIVWLYIFHCDLGRFFSPQPNLLGCTFQYNAAQSQWEQVPFSCSPSWGKAFVSFAIRDDVSGDLTIFSLYHLARIRCCLQFLSFYCERMLDYIRCSFLHNFKEPHDSFSSLTLLMWCTSLFFFTEPPLNSWDKSLWKFSFSFSIICNLLSLSQWHKTAPRVGWNGYHLCFPLSLCLKH